MDNEILEDKRQLCVNENDKLEDKYKLINTIYNIFNYIGIICSILTVVIFNYFDNYLVFVPCVILFFIGLFLNYYIVNIDNKIKNNKIKINFYDSLIALNKSDNTKNKLEKLAGVIDECIKVIKR